ncbi:glycosyltransferase family 2 protein [Sphingobacterium faecium]|uniref:glycosyltransferase family 2 protein n=1 Tax=Sphingobacterium faecium TaxID=34087 RepID=UPI0032080D85
MAQISIIIPVYNAEQFLSRCLDSVLQQTFVDFEVLLINDGSSDSSQYICDQYQAQDSRIRVFHQENSGVSAVRQKGIDLAKGKYSIHVDADDYIAPTMLAEMHAHIGEHDILVADYLKVSDKETLYISQSAIQGLDKSAIFLSVFLKKIHGFMWNKLVRHAIYKEFDIHFPIGHDYCEDQIVFLQMVNSNLSIGYLARAFYHYVHNPNSITQQSTVDSYSKIFKYSDFIDRMPFISDQLKSINHIQIKVQCMYSKQFDASFINRWNKHSDAMIPYAGLTCFTRVRLFMFKIGLSQIAKLTF